MNSSIIQTIAIKNLNRRPVRTWCMIFFTFILSCSLFFTTVLVDSMKNGLEKTVNRLGADIIVVPKEYERNMADSLFLGELCSFSFDKSWINPISEIDGIREITPQLYMKSLAAGCCSAETQLIAFDPQTDFIVSAWLSENNIKMPKFGEVIIGHLISPENPGEIRFFDRTYKVIGKLDRTGSNYDTCVFMTYETAKDIMGSERWYEAFYENPDAENLVSSLLIRTEEGADAKQIARSINYSLAKDSPIAAYTANGIMADAMKNVNNMTGYSTVLIGLIFILVVVALFSIFTITINERTREFGIYSALGTPARKLSGIVLTEGLLIGLAGGLIGAVFAAAGTVIFGNTIVVLMEIPELNVNPFFLTVLGLKCIVLALVVSALSSLYSAWKVSRVSLDGLIKGEEL